MEREQFNWIVHQSEKAAARSPRLYQLSVLLRALGGYLFFWALVPVSLALIAGGFVLPAYADRDDFVPFVLLGILMVAAGAYGIYFAIRSLSFRMVPPWGVEVTRDTAPALWALVDELCATMKIRRSRVHRLLLNAELSAAVVQHPRRGLIFGSRNYVICGLPLMMGVDRDHFAAILAHELGHLSRGHGAIASWIYRVNQTWQRVLQQTSQRPKHPLSRFIRWYGPRLAAKSYVLRRQQEHEADRLSAAATGTEAFGDGLLLTYLREAQYNEYWTTTFRRAATEPHPPMDVLAGIRSAFAVLPDEVSLRRELGTSLARRTIEHHSHPSLADRLDRVGYLSLREIAMDRLRGEPAQVAQNLPLPRFALPSAAETLLGDRLGELQAAVNNDWAIEIAEGWGNRHGQLLHDRGHLALLDRRASGDGPPLTADEALLRATIFHSLEDDKPRRRELLEEAERVDPQYPPTIYGKGRLLLKDRDRAGVALVERAMELDPEAVTPGAELLHEFYVSQNEHAAAESVLKALDARRRQLELAHTERNLLTVSDEFDPHGLPDHDVRTIISICRTLPYLDRVYLVKRRVRHYPAKPSYALVAPANIPLWRWPTRRWVKRLSAELMARARLSQPVSVFVLGDDQKLAALRSRFRGLRAHCVYDRAVHGEAA